MEDGEETNFGAQMLGIGGDSAQGLGSGAEQNAVDHFLILVGDGGNLFRQRKDHMEVLGREKFGAPILEPFSAGKRLAFWAMAIRAGVIRVALMAAPVALFEMTTKNGGAAGLDRRHHAALRDR